MTDDLLKELAERIATAHARGAPLEIRGGGGKRFYGNPPTGELLMTAGLRGVVEYAPSELFVCARTGAPLAELEAALAERGQMLAFEPPHFGDKATVGGATACGLSGPRRPFAGAARDYVLGVELLDGRGKLLRFGGRMIKNVAGFDLSRLSVGALGTLGVLTEVTLRTAPRPAAELTVAVQCPAGHGVKLAGESMRKGLPVSATAWHRGILHVRLSGAERSTARAAREVGGELLDEEDGRIFWESLREQRHEFFNDDENLWRIGCAPLAPLAPEPQLIEWRGALRWLRGSRRAALRVAEKCDGHLTLFRAEDDAEENRFPALPPATMELHRRLKRVFDPADILNRGRLHSFSPTTEAAVGAEAGAGVGAGRVGVGAASS